MTQVQTVTLTSEDFDDTRLLHFPSLTDVAGFSHAVTTRPWNMVPHQGSQAELAVERRRGICRHLGLPFERLTAPEQIHSPHVLRVLPSDVGAGRLGKHHALRFVDGMVCDLPATALMQLSADCPIVAAVDPQRRVFGTAHASWRGTIAGISAELVRQLRNEFGIEPAGLIVGVCPCAGPTEYEVGDEVLRIARARWPDAEQFFPSVGGRRFFDLRAANVAQLAAAGVRPERISVARACTIRDRRFFSHRRDGAETGRFALVAGFR